MAVIAQHRLINTARASGTLGANEMVDVRVLCYHCQSENLVRNGHTPKGKQKYLCKDCGRQSREKPKNTSYSKERRDEILRAYRESGSIRGLARIFGVSRNTVASWLKESKRR